MSPLILVGILVITSTTFADVKHVLEGSADPSDRNSISPQAVNHLDANPPNGQFWWMNSNSPFKAAHDDYKKCLSKGNCLPQTNSVSPVPQPFRPQDTSSTPSLNVKQNPFLNGNFNPSSGNANYNNGNSKIDVKKNPFFSGSVLTAGNGAPVVKDQNGFLGVQPSQPFSKRPGFGSSHPSEQQKIPQSNKNLLNVTVECKGAGFACIDKSLCLNGVVNKNGEGLLQVRSDVRYCHEDTEVCCQMNDANEISAGKSSTIKFAGGAGFSPGLIHVQPLDVKPEIIFAGEHGHHSSSTAKNIRDTSFSPNSVFSSTVDYSDTKFDDDVRLAGPFQGPGYLPPVGPSPAPKPTVNQEYVPSRPSTPKYVPPAPTTPRPTPPPFSFAPSTSRPAPSYSPPTSRPAPSYSQPTVRPIPSYSPPAFKPTPPPVTHRPVQPTYRPAPPVTFRPEPAPTTSREYLPPRVSTPRPTTTNQYVSPQKPYQPSLIPKQPYQPTTQKPFQPSFTPQKPFQPSVTPQKPYQPSFTPQQPYQPSFPTQKPYQPSVVTQKPYQPPKQPYQPSVTPQKPFQPSFTPQQPSFPTQKPYQPSFTPQQPFKPSVTPQKPYQPSFTPQQPSVTPQKPYQPSFTTQKPYQPSFTPQQPSITPQKPYQPSFTPQQPSITPQKPYQPSFTPQQPSVTPQKPYQPSFPTQKPYQPSFTPQQPTQKPYQPYQPSVKPYQPQQTTSRPYQPPQQPYQPTTNREYLPPKTPAPFVPQPSSPRPNPFVTHPTTPRRPPPPPPPPTTRPPPPPPPPSTRPPQYTNPSAPPTYTRPAPPRPQPSGPPAGGYHYPTPNPPFHETRPNPPPFRPTPSIPQFSTPSPQPRPTPPPQPRPTPPPQPRPTPPPVTNGYQYPSPSQRPNPFIPQQSTPRPGPSYTNPQYISPSTNYIQPSTPSRPYQPSTQKPYQPPTQKPYQPPAPKPYQPPAPKPYQPPAPQPYQPPAPKPYQPPAPKPYQPPAPKPYQPPAPKPYQPPAPKPYQPPAPTQKPYQPPAPQPYQPPAPTQKPYQPPTQKPYQPSTPAPNPSGGYVYPKPTPSFEYPSPSSPRPDFSNSNVNNQYIPPPKKPSENPDQTFGAANIDDAFVKPTTARTQFQGELNTAPPPGCAAALKCVQEIYCSAEGVISPVPVVLTKEQELARVPTTECQDTESGIIGKCCRDPNYKDPWPSANLVDGVDDGQYKEDDSFGKYQPDLQRNVRSDKGGPRQDVSQNRNTNFQPTPQPTCGVRHLNTNPKGPGPLDVNFAEIPWQAMILRDSNRSLLCGGVIIRNNAVLTAAHCVEGLETSDILIKGGEWKLGIDEEPLPFQIVKVATVIKHPQYQTGSFVNDLALLILEEKLRTAKNIGTLCLPAPNQIPTQNCIATGWGKRILQLHAKGAIMHSIDVKIMDNQQCQDTLANKFQHAAGNYSPNTLCGYSDINQCKVDYGSALACSDGNQYTLSGIYSWDTGCKQEGQIGGYVAPDVEWIESTLSKSTNKLKKY